MTMLLGSQSMKNIINYLVSNVDFTSNDRYSKLYKIRDLCE